LHVTKFDQKSYVITSTVKEKSVFPIISIKDVKYFYSITCKATELDVLREHESVKGNGRKKVLVIGKTGTGKSSLCNVISGHSHDADVFDVSSAPTSKQETQIADVFFDNQRSKLISLIDTFGFDDPKKDNDAQIVADLVSKLKNNVDFVNTFIIAVNGQNPRLDGSLLAMIKIFEAMFGVEFWGQTVIVFTRLPMDQKSVRRREKITQKKDDEIFGDYIRAVENKFPNGTGLEHMIIDACYDTEDIDGTGKEAFQKAMNKLWEKIHLSTELGTEKVEVVKSESQMLKDLIAKRDDEIRKKTEESKKADEETKRKIAALEKEVEQEENNIAKLRNEIEKKEEEFRENEKKYEEEQRKFEEEIKQLTEVEKTKKLTERETFKKANEHDQNLLLDEISKLREERTRNEKQIRGGNECFLM